MPYKCQHSTCHDLQQSLISKCCPMLAPNTAEGHVSTNNSILAARIKQNVCCIPAHFVLDCSRPIKEALSPPASACDPGTKFLPCQTCMCFIEEERLPQGYQLEMQQCSRRFYDSVLQCYCIWSRPALATSVPSTEGSCTNCYTFSAGATIDWILYNKMSRQLHAQSLHHRVGMCCCHTGAEMSLWNGTSKCWPPIKDTPPMYIRFALPKQRGALWRGLEACAS